MQPEPIRAKREPASFAGRKGASRIEDTSVVGILRYAQDDSVQNSEGPAP